MARLPKVRDYLEWGLDWYEAEHPTTITKARSEVKRFIERFGHRPIDSIRAVGVEQNKRSRLLDDKAAKETVGQEIRRLKAAFNRSVEWKELDLNPLASVKAPRGVRSVVVKFYDRAAMRRLYRANPARASLRLFMAHTGLRRGEVVGLGKRSVVGDRLMVESDPSDWLSRDAAAAEIDGHLHRLRHTFCAHLVMQDVPLRRVQVLAGHADYATTEKYYAQLTPGGMSSAARTLRF